MVEEGTIDRGEIVGQYPTVEGTVFGRTPLACLPAGARPERAAFSPFFCRPFCCH
jgi:hypothetical protein